MDDIIYQIALLLLSVIGLLLTKVGVPFIKGKLSTEQLNIIATWVRVAVAAAEQIYKSKKQGINKKIYVIEFLAEKGIKLSQQELDVLIEAAVYELNNTKELLYLPAEEQID